MDENLVWDIRHFVYQHFAETTRPPSAEATAARFGLSHEEAASAYAELHQRHAFFLKPDTHEILMANPFSGVETPFKVQANNKTYFANCAWDSLGIPAALHIDAEVEAECAQSEEPIHLTVSGQQASAPETHRDYPGTARQGRRSERSRGVQDSNALVHFLVPFKDWYDDLSVT